jgi:hypothetical protein
MHEDFNRNPEIKLSSDRTFGLVWTVLLILYGLAPLRHARGIRVWPIVLAGALVLLSLFFSRALHGPNIWWGKVGVLLNRAVNPIVMGLMFYICFVPVGLINRLRKKDPLQLGSNPSATTYWIDREPADSSRSSMTHQY